MSADPTLYVWEPEGGGVSLAWYGLPPALAADWSFFVFGRYGAGWKPLARLDSPKMRAHAEAAAARVLEKYDLRVRVLYGTAPPEHENVREEEEPCTSRSTMRTPGERP